MNSRFIKSTSLLVILTMLVSARALANDRSLGDAIESRVFASFEANGEDSISTFGLGMTFKQPSTNLGVQFNAALMGAELLTQDGYIEDYGTLEASAKFGYFSMLSVYVEGGFDVLEALVQDYRDDDFSHFPDEEVNGLDSFIGVGVGFSAGVLSLESFVRIRAIDADNWEAESEVFSGLQLSLNF